MVLHGSWSPSAYHTCSHMAPCEMIYSVGIGQDSSEVKLELEAAVKARALAGGPGDDDDRLTCASARMAPPSARGGS
jgi:hypothetical protein